MGPEVTASIRNLYDTIAAEAHMSHSDRDTAEAAMRARWGELRVHRRQGPDRAQALPRPRGPGSLRAGGAAREEQPRQQPAAHRGLAAIADRTGEMHRTPAALTRLILKATR